MARRLPRTTPDAQRTLTPRQIELLRQFDVSADRATYTGGEVIRDWAEVKEVFLLLGARWVRGVKGKPGAFVFAEHNAADKVELTLQTGKVLDPRLVGFFPTPEDVASHVVRQSGLDVITLLNREVRVLEPSAGEGALCDAIRRSFPRAQISAYELLDKNVRVLTEKGYTVAGRDFLQAPVSPIYSAVVMNPPFSGKDDIVHVQHAFRFLVPKGRLTAIMSGGTLFRGDRETTAFRAWVQDHKGTLESLPAQSFKSSGTLVSTVLCTVEKP